MKKAVFISSTFLDLAPHRKAIWELLEEFDVSVRGMEQFGARTGTPLETCIAELEQSDVYVGVIAFRFGSLHIPSGKSFTQLEYERAQFLSKETLIYLIDEENASVQVKFMDKGAELEKLEAFKRTLRDRHTIDTFVSPDDLVEKLRRDLQRHVGTSKAPAINDETNEFDDAVSVIKNFILVPKKVAGREVHIEVTVTGEPYPASSEICLAFNYELGATVGVPVKITRPEEAYSANLTELYFDAKQLDEFLPVTVGERRDIYAKLLFHDSPVQETHARYRDSSYYPKSPFSALSSISSVLGERVELPADAKLILAYTKPAGLQAPSLHE